MKVLLSAYACEPNRGSEPGVGWNMAKTIASKQQVHVLTSATHRAGIEAELANHPDPNLEFTYLDPFRWVYDWSREKRIQVDVHLHYYLWQIKAYQVAKVLHQQQAFDLAHHVTYVKYYSPSFLAWLPIPFIWGPVGGAEAAPAPFWQDFKLRDRLYETLRTIGRTVGELDPFVRMTVRRSAMLWATTQDTAARLRHLGGAPQRVFVESSLHLHADDLQRLAALPPVSQTSVRFISIGRLLHWKGFHLGIRAFAAANLPNAEFWIVGTGPEAENLQALAESLNVADRVKFFGYLPQAQAMEKLGQASVLVHPSLHDSGGWVCLEAMAAARPVLCLDLGGPGAQVNSSIGFKVPATTPTDSVQKMAQIMQQLAQNPRQIQTIGNAAQMHVQATYAWAQRAVFLDQLYAEVVPRVAAPPVVRTPVGATAKQP
ncbi:glycosyltransferase [filamentous cyanobacterium LEGE 11480]|uniref:Glycosyltransferase n=1 Tax=Romeriopsis navalis LEGE 11480 TaxID=2777977 RepID=A0A928Z4D1_9CYAN|nr:glycosyltransferase [Romeriopsis navalis]MBE9030198.1 glycosyltransferase [Romeriopsis navalis LEGE 11480]